MTLDIIITTYNRPQSILALCNQIISFKKQYNLLIVVDSSDTYNDSLSNNKEIVYLHSKHKSQPYQRYLGTTKTNAELVLFLDDDLIIQEESIFTDIKDLFQSKPDVIGINLGIDHENPITNNLPTQKKSENIVLKKLRSLFQTPAGKIGKLSRNTKIPDGDAYVEYLYGATMCYRKEVLPFLFDETLFALFEYKLAMGEDKVISIKASKYGKLYFIGRKKYVKHPAEESSYFTNPTLFYAKLYYSRLWIANEHNKVYKSYFIWIYFLILIVSPILSSIKSIDKSKAYLKFLSYILKYGLVPVKSKITSTTYLA